MANFTLGAQQLHESLLIGWVKDPSFKSDPNMREYFEERFFGISTKEQYQIMAYLFSNIMETELQYWIMSVAHRMFKQPTTSQFKSKTSMVEYFIRNYSFNKEVEELRTSIWAIMK